MQRCLPRFRYGALYLWVHQLTSTPLHTKPLGRILATHLPAQPPLSPSSLSACPHRSRAQVFLDSEDADEAAAQLQSALARACPHVPPLMDPLVVAGPFGGGKRGVLARLGKLLAGVLAAAPVVTTKERPAGAKDGERSGAGVRFSVNWGLVL